MLLNVWDSWWGNIARLRAEEERAYYVVTQAADSGWKLDRDSLWQEWAHLTAPRIRASARPSKDLRGQMVRFADWMMAGFGGLGGLGKLVRRNDRG